MYRLATVIDDICDHVDEAADDIDAYEVQRRSRRARVEQAEVVYRAASQLHEAVELLEGFGDSQRAARRAARARGRGRPARRARRSPTSSARGRDPLTIIRWKDIHEQIEEAVDACENAADVLEAILVEEPVTLLVVTVVVALAFDFTNGFHDTANAVATSVSTRALSPAARRARSPRSRTSPARSSTTAVAKTVGKRDHRLEPRDREDRARRGDRRDRLEPAHVVARAAVVVVARADRRPDRRGARAVGRRAASSGTASRTRCVIPALWAPTIAFAAAFAAAARDLLALPVADARAREPLVPARPARVRHVGRVHARRERRAEDDGRDRARALLARARSTSFYIPTWVKIAAGLAIAAGTYSGGWRIMRTVGQRVYQMEPRERLRRAGDRRRGDLGLDEVRLSALDHARRLRRA